MGDIDLGTLIAKLGLGAGGIAWAVSLAIKKWSETRTGVAAEGAKTDVIDMLAARVTALESAVDKARKEFDTERGLRLEAEGKVAALLRRVAALEEKIRELGHDPEHVKPT